MFIRKIESTDAINSNQIERLYVRKDETDEGVKYAVVAEICLKATEGSEAHYHSERLSSFDTLEAAQEEFDDLIDILNEG